MKPIYKIFILSGILISVFAFTKRYDRPDNPQIVAVTVDVVAKDRGTNPYFMGHNKYTRYFIVITLTNTQDTTIHLITMTCSWEESFVFGDSTMFLYYPGCDSNFPIILDIKAHKSVKFFGELHSRLKQTGNREQSHFKIGFVDRGEKDFWEIPYNRHPEKGKIYWSKDVELRSELYWFKEEEPSKFNQ